MLGVGTDVGLDLESSAVEVLWSSDVVLEVDVGAGVEVEALREVIVVIAELDGVEALLVVEYTIDSVISDCVKARVRYSCDTFFRGKSPSSLTYLQYRSEIAFSAKEFYDRIVIVQKPTMRVLIFETSIQLISDKLPILTDTFLGNTA